jgi:coenzyme F420 hydrogenase subunit beta
VTESVVIESKRDFAALKATVIDTGLCTRCGGCVGVCPDEALEFDDVLGDCLPEQKADCGDCGLCHTACSGGEVLFPELNEQVFGKQPENMLLGHYENIFVGHATDSGIRSRGASGGIVTAVLCYLLEKGEVDGAIVLGMDETEPWKAEVRIARTPQEVQAAAQSKYSLTPVNTIFRELQDLPGRYAYVGLPCQVHSLRKLQAAGHPAANKITHVIGSYCGTILQFDAVRSFLRNNGVHDIEEVVDLQYRAGEWPGQMQITLKSGEVVALKKFYANYLIPFFMVERCKLCTDLANEFADIACGDAWAPVYEERGLGWSLAMGRTAKGAALLETMAAEGRLALKPLPEEEAVGMHSHMLDFKKRGAFLRIERREKRGQAVPEYGFKPDFIPRDRRIFEQLLGAIFWLCSLGLSKWLVEHFPVKITGQLFEKARLTWKRLTRTTKRKGLGHVTFKTSADGKVKSEE